MYTPENTLESLALTMRTGSRLMNMSRPIGRGLMSLDTDAEAEHTQIRLRRNLFPQLEQHPLGENMSNVFLMSLGVHKFHIHLQNLN